MTAFCVREGCNRDQVPGSNLCVVHANAMAAAKPRRCDCLNPACTDCFPVRHRNSTRFHAILAELGELHDRKQRDYGKGDDPFANVRASTEWGVDSWVGAMIRATDKLRRLQSYASNGTLANEGVEDSLRDLAVYSVIALVLFEQESKE